MKLKKTRRQIFCHYDGTCGFFFNNTCGFFINATCCFSIEKYVTGIGKGKKKWISSIFSSTYNVKNSSGKGVTRWGKGYSNMNQMDKNF